MGITGERFQELYDEYWALVYTVCRSRLGNHEEALDTAQDIFIRKWQARERYDPQQASFRSWLVRNAVNACIDVLRARTRHPDEEVLLEAKHLITPGCEEAAVQHVIISDCLDKLTDEARQFVLMHAVEEYTWEEIAAITGLTVSQARTRTAHANKAFKALLAMHNVDAEL